MSRLTITNVISGQQVASHKVTPDETKNGLKDGERTDKKRTSTNTRKPTLDKIPETELQQTGQEPALLLGRWLNTEEASKGFCEIEFLDAGPQIKMRAFGLDEKGNKVELAEVPVDIFTDTENQFSGGNKFSANFDFPLIRASLHGWVKQGVLVISVFNVYKNSEKGRNYFCREFFYAA
ncbi:hypothetical protein SG34_014795 [Thalassomonas viridans]|uniref:Uncharacterized protein n=1 Tax=Thalassomonas viridans TaxID=137584 RepID=A0AAE9Z768_9GAMM|nr:hypothetical protein [Thalassomonas viridans]WDE08046.1 hypothetical protein SG34_014795 [Thalassomonas viridans]